MLRNAKPYRYLPQIPKTCLTFCWNDKSNSSNLAFSGYSPNHFSFADVSRFHVLFLSPNVNIKSRWFPVITFPLENYPFFPFLRLLSKNFFLLVKLAILKKKIGYSLYQKTIMGGWLVTELAGLFL